MASIPCLLCGLHLQRKMSKTDKPYFVCDPCGVQIFVRRKEGIKKLDALIRSLEERDLPLHIHAEALFEIRGILQELDGIEEELKKLDSFSVFSDKSAKSKARRILKERQKRLLASLQRIAKRAA